MPLITAQTSFACWAVAVCRFNSLNRLVSDNNFSCVLGEMPANAFLTCERTSSAVTPSSRSARLSPQQTIGTGPARATFALLTVSKFRQNTACARNVLKQHIYQAQKAYQRKFLRICPLSSKCMFERPAMFVPFAGLMLRKCL